MGRIAGRAGDPSRRVMSAAAELLGVDRATVIRRLDSLETKLKSRLFDRRPDGCTLTAAGRNIIGLVEGVEQAMTALAHRVEGEDGRSRGSGQARRARVPAVEHHRARRCRHLRTMHPDLSPRSPRRVQRARPGARRGRHRPAVRPPGQRGGRCPAGGTLAVVLCASPDYLARAGLPAGGDSRVTNCSSSKGRWANPGDGLAAVADLRSAGRDAAQRDRAVRRGGAGRRRHSLRSSDRGRSGRGLVPVSPGIVGRCDMYLATHRDLRSRARVRTVYRLPRAAAREATPPSSAGAERGRRGRGGKA